MMLLGTWYSMTKGAHCPSGKPLGTNNCAWAINRRIKTINGTCAMNQYGMAQACKRDPVFPFNQASQALQRALVGCPALTPPPNAFDDEPTQLSLLDLFERLEDPTLLSMASVHQLAYGAMTELTTGG
jgi:hypothetical protein